MPRLRRSQCTGPGIVRVKRCARFSYRYSNGAVVHDEEALARIAALAIPPAWVDVWICPWPNGHIQALGTDAAGRRQYRYHEQWRRRRDAEKFERMLQFARALPVLRAQVAADLASADLGRACVLAAAVRLLDLGAFRIGGESYADEHETYGIATLLKCHVKVDGDELLFDYPAKGGKERVLTVRDAEVARIVAALKRRRGGGPELLAFKQHGTWCDLRSADINAYLKEICGEHCSAKDFRTWSATFYAAITLATTAMPESRSARQRARNAVVRATADLLGNTPTVCRASYIDPHVLDRFEIGDAVPLNREELATTGAVTPERRNRLEALLVDFLDPDLTLQAAVA
jgi:DNA topoisomerase IB